MNFWAYIAIFAIGIIAGMIIEWYIIRDRIGDRKTVEIRRNKQKGGPGNEQDLSLELNEAENARSSRREERESRQEANKLKRNLKKAERQLNNQLKPKT